MSTATEATVAAAPSGLTPPSTPDAGSRFLSDVIIELGLSERADVERAEQSARSKGSTVGRVLLEMGNITEEELARATAERHGIPHIDLTVYDVDPAAANLIKPTAAKRYRSVPVAFVPGGLLVAMADPAEELGINDIALMTKLEVQPAVAARPAIESLLDRLPLDGPAGNGASAAEGDRDEPGAGATGESVPSAVFWQADGESGEGPALEDLMREIEQASAAAERAFEQLRLAQQRLRDALAEAPNGSSARRDA